MKLHTDSYFHIGFAHLKSGRPCQDYAIADKNDNGAWAIISDGCSTGRNTDVGARIVSLITAEAICRCLERDAEHLLELVEIIKKDQKEALAKACQMLGLNVRDMLATCLYSFVSNNRAVVNIQGDGVIAFKYKCGSIEMSRFEWLNNMPFYPAYGNGYIEDFVRSHEENSVDAFSQDRYLKETDGNLLKLCPQSFSLFEGMKGISIDISAPLISGELEYVAVFSDGITQVENVDWKDAVEMFLAFKNKKGEFLKRRMIRGIKDIGKEGKRIFDDISCAIIRVEELSEKEKSDDSTET